MVKVITKPKSEPNQDGDAPAGPELVCGLPHQTSPKALPKPKGAGAVAVQKLALSHWLKVIATTGKDVPHQELADIAGHTSANYVATTTGHGKGGLKMWKAKKEGRTVIGACKENAAIAIKFLYANCSEVELMGRVAADLGMSEKDLQAAFDKLPTAEVMLAKLEVPKQQEVVRSEADDSWSEPEPYRKKRSDVYPH